MDLLVFTVVLVVLTVIPVMLAAKLFGAPNTSFWACVIAVAMSVAASSVSAQFIANPGLAGFAALALTAVCFSVILGTSYLHSFLIALLSIGIQYGLVMLVAGLGIAYGVVEVTG